MLLLLAGCDGPETTPPAEAPTWHADVAPIVTRSCTGCHADGGNGPFSLVSYAEAAPMADAIAAAVEARTMPPWLAAPDCNTYQGERALTEAEIATIRAWAAGGAPEGDTADAVAATPLADPELESVDLTLSMPEAYTPVSSPDDYRCFLLDWPLDTGTYVTGFRVAPGNTQTVHHAIAFVVNDSEVDAYRALDDADPEPGYTCYGAPGGDDPVILFNLSWLGSWAPGGGTALFPPDTGIYVRPGALVALQMHYNTSHGEGSDLTSIDFQLADSVEHGAILQPWTDVAWVLGGGMEIPAHTDGVTHAFEYDSTEEDGDYLLHSAALHMHTHGRSATFEVEHPDGSKDCLLDVERYDFDWQRSYYMEEPVRVSPGDTVRVTCTWDNDTDEDLDWGEGTGDEMCLGTTYLTDDY